MFFYILFIVMWSFQKQPPEVLSKNTFLTENLQTTASEFLQKDIDKFKECQTNESTKKILLRRKKGKHGTQGNELKCQLPELKA